jgi:ABC-type uncharacterized transport system fused permease/ATPase subunit
MFKKPLEGDFRDQVSDVAAAANAALLRGLKIKRTQVTDEAEQLMGGLVDAYADYRLGAAPPQRGLAQLDVQLEALKEEAGNTQGLNLARMAVGAVDNAIKGKLKNSVGI